MRRFFNLESMTVIGAILGIFSGSYFPEFAQRIQFIGAIFLNCLKCLLIPIVVSSIFLAITMQKKNEEDSLISLSKWTISYYTVTSMVACLIGLFMAHLFIVGNNSISTISIPNIQTLGISTYSFNWNDFLTSFFPSNILVPVVEGKILPLIVVTLFFSSAALNLKTNQFDSLFLFVESINDISMRLIKWTLFLAPAGVFVLIANLLAKASISLTDLWQFMVATSLAAFIHSFIFLPVLLYFLGGVNPLKFFWNVKKALIVALTTASSSATLPISMAVLEKNEGVKRKHTGFVLPLGATLNMDGCALYQAIIVLFLAQLSGIRIDFAGQIMVFAFIMLSSAGTAGIPGGGVVIVGATLEMLNIPLETLGLYILVDRFWDYPITAINVWGDLIGAKLVGCRQEEGINLEQRSSLTM